MAIRLYPITNNPAVLEKLTNVPAGTMDRLKAIEAHYKDARNRLNDEFPTASEERRNELRTAWSDLDEREWSAKQEDHNISTLNNFLTFGWGRLFDPCGLCKEDSGRLTEPFSVLAVLNCMDVLLTDHGVTVQEIEGIRWC